MKLKKLFCMPGNTLAKTKKATKQFGTKCKQFQMQICKLLFSLPFTYAHVERMFLTLKIIKTNRRTNLQISSLALYQISLKSMQRVLLLPGSVQINLCPSGGIHVKQLEGWVKCQEKRTGWGKMHNHLQLQLWTRKPKHLTATLVDWDDWLKQGPSTSAVEKPAIIDSDTKSQVGRFNFFIYRAAHI